MAENASQEHGNTITSRNIVGEVLIAPVSPSNVRLLLVGVNFIMYGFVSQLNYSFRQNSLFVAQ